MSRGAQMHSLMQEVLELCVQVEDLPVVHGALSYALASVGVISGLPCEKLVEGLEHAYRDVKSKEGS